MKHTSETLFDIKIERFVFDDIDNQKLALEILDQQKRMSDNPDDSFYEDTIFDPEPNSEGKKAFDKFVELFKGHNYSIYQHWTHIHQPLESTSSHRHGKYPYSFVYYVKVPTGSGNLIFELDQIVSVIEPKVGNMIVFPGWLKHKVSKNIGKEIRISWSGNLGNIFFRP